MSNATKELDLIATIDAWRIDKATREQRVETERKRIASEAADRDPRVSAARLLGMATREVTAVSDVAQGLRIDLFDGSAFLLVPDDKPDADGKIGLLQCAGAVSKYSRIPVYSVFPTPRPPAARTPAAEPEPDDPPAMPMDDPAALAIFEAEAAAADAAVDAPGNEYQRPHLEDQARALRKIVQRRRAAVTDRELRENPPPPAAYLVHIQTGAYRLARAFLDPSDDRTRDQQTAQVLEEFPELTGGPMTGYMQSIELKSATKFFETHGLPLPDAVQP